MSRISRLLVIVFVCMLTACQALPPAPAQVEKSGGVSRYGAAELRYEQGIPLLSVSGSHYEMGCQYGALLKGELAAVMADFDGLAERVKASRPWYQRVLAPLWIAWYTHEFGGRLPAEYLDEIRGMAEASGQDYRKLLFIALGAGFTDTANCTGVLVKLGERILLGRNFDWEPMFLTEHPLIVEYRPEGRLAVTNFGFVGVPGVVQGVNSAGLALTTNIAFRLYRDTEANNGPSIVFKNRAVLEQASSLDAAERLYRAQPTDEAGWMITLASAAEKDGAIIELYDNQVARSGLKQGRAHIHNILFDPARLGSAALSRRNTELKMALDEYNVRREFETGRKLKTVDSVDAMLGYLADTSFYDYRDVVLTNCGTINNDYTINTLVFDPARRQVYYAVAPGFSALSKIYRYDLASRRLSLYRPADARLGDPHRQAKMRWFDAYLNLKYCADYAAIVRLVDLDDPQLDPVQLRYAVEAWFKAPGAVEGEALVAALERMSRRYPRYGLPQLYRAKLLARLGRRAEAVEALEQTLACADSSPDVRLAAQLLLAEQAEGLRRKAAQAAYVAAIDELARTWRIEEDYRQPYVRMKASLRQE